LIPNLCKLVTDSESEVRSQTLKSMCQWINKISVDKISTVIIPSIKNLSNDSNNNVKLALSRLLGVLCKVCGEEITTNKLYPIAIELINYCESNDVKIQIVKSLKEFILITGYDLMTASLNNMLMILSKEKYWRIRKAVVSLSIAIGQKSNDQAFEDYENVLLKGLFDSAYKVRVKTIKGIKVLGQNFGSEWILGKILPHLTRAWEADDVNYLQRNTVINALLICSEFLSFSIVEKSIIPLIKKGLDDPIPNVKFVTLRSIPEYMKIESLKTKKEFFKDHFYSDIENLSKNVTDEDVKL